VYYVAELLLYFAHEHCESPFANHHFLSRYQVHGFQGGDVLELEIVRRARDAYYRHVELPSQLQHGTSHGRAGQEASENALRGLVLARRQLSVGEYYTRRECVFAYAYSMRFYIIGFRSAQGSIHERGVATARPVKLRRHMLEGEFVSAPYDVLFDAA
jgi:hypothetical protein